MVDFETFLVSLEENHDMSLTLSYDVAIREKQSEKVAEALKYNRRLKELHINRSGIGDGGVLFLCEALKVNQTLTELSLRNNSIRCLGASYLSEALQANKTLVSLDLGGNFVGDEGIHHISSALKENVCLSSLSLRSNHIGNLGAGYLARALELNSGLEVLDMRSNNIYNLGTMTLIESLKSNSSLRELKLDQNPFDCVGISLLSDCLSVNKSLTKMSLVSCAIGESGAIHISDALAADSRLRSLNIACTNLGDIGVGRIGEGLKLNSSLEKLILDGNRVADVGIVQLASALSCNGSLTELSLSHNKIGHEGAKHIALALEKNANLAKLSLNGNRIGDAGACHISKCISSNKGLLELNLSCNNIGKIGINHLVKGLVPNYTLIELQLDWNRQVSLEKVHDILERNDARRREKFAATLSGDEAIPWNRSRIMFVGEGKVGKTATVRSLHGEPFISEWDSTIGAALSRIETCPFGWSTVPCREPTENTVKFAAQIVLKGNTDLQPHIAAETLKFSNGRNYRPVVLKKLQEASKIFTTTPGFSKSQHDTLDTRNRKVMLNGEMKEVCVEYEDEVGISKIPANINSRLFFDTKKEARKLSLSLWDFGGQEAFHAIHHILLTESGLYVLVFDMREIIHANNKEARDNLAFWLRSISIHAPGSNLIMVGTFCDSVEGAKDLERVDSNVRDLVELYSIIENTNSGLSFFPIDNKSQKGILDLRLNVEEIIRSDTAVKQPVSIKFIRFLDSLLSFREDHKYIRYSDAVHVATTIGLNTNEVDEALLLFHQRGIIVHLNATEALKSIITIEPQWLIDGIAVLIRDFNIHSYDVAEIKQSGLEDDMKNLVEKGLASRDLMEYLWHNFEFDYFLDLMQKSLLLSEWNFKQEKLYLIPSLLSNESMVKAKPNNGSIISFDFSESFLPSGFFQRLVCLCVEYSSMKSNSYELKLPTVRGNLASIDFGTYKVQVMQGENAVTAAVTPNDCGAVASTALSAMINKINNETMHGRLKWTVKLDGVPISAEDPASDEFQNDYCVDLGIFLQGLV